MTDAKKAADKKTVDGYVAGLDGWRAEVVSTLRDLVREAAPGAKESIKWSQPVYEEHGPFCYIRAFKGHVNFGFWRGAQLADPEGLLSGDGDKMRHVKLTGPEQVRPAPFQELVRAAVALNREHGDPSRG